MFGDGFGTALASSQGHSVGARVCIRRWGLLPGGLDPAEVGNATGLDKWRLPD